MSKHQDWTSPLKECWSVEMDSPFWSRPASDNDKVFFTTSKGSVVAVSQETGSIEWAADLGGNIWTELRVLDNRLFTAAYFGNGGIEEKTVLREINPDSGVPFWQNEDSLGFPLFQTLRTGDGTTVLSQEGVFLKLDRVGKVSLRRNLGTKITSNIVEDSGQLIFGTPGKTIIFFDTETGLVIKQLNSRFVPVRIAVNGDGLVFAGDKFGRIKAFRIDTAAEVWSVKTGAAITEISIHENDLIVSSNDNFVYRISGRNGYKEWKRKLAGRILGGSVVDPGFEVFLTTGSTTAVILSLENGNLVNKIDINRPFVSGPVKINGGFAVPTDTSLIAISSGECKK